jgi:sulfur-oxidizing protein SoxY
MPRTAALVILSFLAAAGLTRPALAEVDEAARAQRWAELQGAIFGDRKVEDGKDMLAIEAPDRAADAALVPVRIRLSEELRPRLRHLWFVIDENPSPLAGSFAFGPAALADEIATRVRVNDYTYLHAVAETTDGSLYAAQRFIKAAGGCSAPAGKDQALAMERLGRMKMSFAGGKGPGEAVEAHLLISHPNNSGMQMDQMTRLFIPADFVRRVAISYEGTPVLTVESDISMSEDPSLTFHLAPKSAGGEIAVVVDDSSNRHFEQRWRVPAQPGS